MNDQSDPRKEAPDSGIEVSVITTTYNRAELLRRTWGSLRDQPCRFEWIVVDDASTDNTAEVVREFHDPRIAYVRLARNSGGPAVGRNRGAAMARGRFVVFVDDDDELYPGALRSMIEVMDRADPSIGAALFQCILDGNRTWREDVEDGAVYDETDVVCRRVLGLEKIIVYRREVFEEFHLPEDLRFMELLFVFGLTRKYKLLMKAEPGRYYHFAGRVSATDVDRTISTSHLIARGYERILENHRVVLSRCPEGREWYMLKALYRYAVAGARADARRMLLRLLREGSHAGRAKALAFALLGELRLMRPLERLRLPVAARQRIGSEPNAVAAPVPGP